MKCLKSQEFSHRLGNYKPLLCLALALLPTLSPAATPRVMLEKSASYALDNQVRAFRVPTIDINGKLKYYDVTITLEVGTDGKLLPTADVASKLAPNVISGAMIPGVYTQDNNIRYTCTVSNANLSNGRVQSFFSCTGYYANFQFSVVTGKVAAGHPYLAELLAAGVNARSDVNTQAWGVITSAFFSMNGCVDKTYNAKTPVGARTDGKHIIISLYTKTKPSGFVCGGNLTAQ